MSILPHKLRIVRAFSFALAVAGIEPLAAQQLAPPPPPPPAPRFAVRPARVALTVGATSAAWLATQVLRDRLPHASCSPCDRSRLPGIDRAILGPERDGVARTSDLALAVTVAGAGAMIATQGGDAGRTEDLAVLAQALSLTSALTAWSKIAFHRPRPVRYAADTTRPLEAEDGLSFPSGHASVAFAAAAAYASIQHRRGIGGRRTTTAVLLSAATATAVLRVAARRHFPTDVLAGAVLGGAVGWLVPAVYPMR